MNNAGMLLVKPLLETTDSEISQIVAVDFIGAALVMRISAR